MRIPTLPESCVSNPLQQGELISAIHDSALHKSWLQTSISPSLIHFFKSLSAICWFSSVCQPSADMILLLSNDANEHVEVEARLKDKLRVNCDNLIFFICRVRVLMISDDKCWWWCNIYIYIHPPGLWPLHWRLPRSQRLLRYHTNLGWYLIQTNGLAIHVFDKSTAGVLPCFEPPFKFSESPLK